MKKIFLVTLILFTGLIKINAQKLFATNTGQVSFYAGTPLEDVRAVNNEADSKMLQKNGQIAWSSPVWVKYE